MKLELSNWISGFSFEHNKRGILSAIAYEAQFNCMPIVVLYAAVRLNMLYFKHVLYTKSTSIKMIRQRGRTEVSCVHGISLTPTLSSYLHSVAIRHVNAAIQAQEKIQQRSALFFGSVFCFVPQL